jgi:23S rRNA pseudouridine2457 synthase
MEVVKLFHKPYGVLSQFKPNGEKRTLTEFPQLAGGRAVGRLDEDSEGLLVVSNLPWVQTVLTRPGHVEKTYWAQVERVPDAAALVRLQTGVVLKDGPTRPAKARLLEDPGWPERSVPIRFRRDIPTQWVELRLLEGRNRQVRRMTAAVGHPTLRLVRVAIGALQLGELEAGQCRPLRVAEERWLQRLQRL